MFARLAVLVVLSLVPWTAAARLGFQAREDFPTGPAPRSVLPAHVNDDDYTDLVTSDEDGISVLFGTPLGRLSAPLAVPTELSTYLLAAGDFDGDTHDDLAYTDRNGRRIVLRRGDGSGGFTGWQELAVETRAIALAAADLDGDGHLDLIVAAGNALLSYLSNGKAFAEPKSMSLDTEISGLALADLDADHLPDVVARSAGRRQLHVFRNIGNGRFAPRQQVELPMPADDLVILDANADSRADLAVIDPLGVVFLRQVDRGEFTDPVRLYQSSGCRALGAIDLTRDGNPDLVVLDDSRAIVLVLAGDGEGGFSAAGAYDVGRASGGLAAFELGRRDVPSVAALNRRESCVTLLYNAPRGAVNGAPVYGAGEGPVGGVAADLDGDARPDVVLADEKAGAVLVYLGSDHPQFRQRPAIAVGRGTRAVAVGDFDGDRLPDIAAANFASNDVAVLAGAGDGRFASPLLLSAGVGPVALTTLDINGDGALDLAVANHGSSSVSIFIGKGDGRFEEAHNFALPRAPDFLIAGDIDGDRDADLVVGSNATDEVWILESGPAGLKQPRRSDKGEQVRPSIAADFNGDKRIDLAMVDSRHDRIGILLGAGNNVFQEPAFFPVTQQPTNLIVADFDRDKRPDLVVISTQARTILFLRNTSTPDDDDDPAEADVVPGLTPAPAPPSTSVDGSRENPWGGRVRRW